VFTAFPDPSRRRRKVGLGAHDDAAESDRRPVGLGATLSPAPIDRPGTTAVTASSSTWVYWAVAAAAVGSWAWFAYEAHKAVRENPIGEKRVKVGYHALIRAGLRQGVRVGHPGDGPYVDVVATPLRGHRVSSDPRRDEPGEYAIRAVTKEGRAFLSTLPSENPLDGFDVGQRVQLHPGTDRWMRGDRYGTVVHVTKNMVHVKLDRSGQKVAFAPRNLTHV
jgi:hypothetical protein